MAQVQMIPQSCGIDHELSAKCYHMIRQNVAT